jgi:NAD(P)-dependent dehydrogenase (short-subunit alcohol dehydrogenase family)
VSWSTAAPQSWVSSSTWQRNTPTARRVIVTGAVGTSGRLLCDRFTAEGARVIGARSELRRRQRDGRGKALPGNRAAVVGKTIKDRIAAGTSTTRRWPREWFAGTGNGPVPR